MNKCSLSPESTIRGTLMITAKSMPIPAYTGTYTVTPTQSQQTLETNGKKMVEDVIVEPIPSQYIIPSGTLEVTENGQQSVREYENVNVNVPTPAGEKTINVTQNGTMTEDVTDYATAKVVTNVPASEVDTGTKNISTNGTHNVVGYASANVNVPASAVDTGTKNITENGNEQDVVGYAAVNVNVPNSYSAADEGKVVQSGALVSQSSQTIDTNGTYDTTTKNEVVVNVSGGGTDTMKQYVENTLTSFTDADVTEIREGTFYGSGNALASISLPNVITVNVYAFRSSQASNISLPKVQTIKAGAFMSCTNLETLVFPDYVGRNADDDIWRGCSNLRKIDFGANTAKIGRYQAFHSCTKLDTIVIRATSIPTIGSANAFANSPFKSGGTGGTIYIPKSLYDHLGDGTADDYEAATNWSTVYGYGTITWVKIEGSQYENYYVDGTPIPTP